MSSVTVENMTHHDDGSVTIFGRDDMGEPVVLTYPPGALVTRYICPKCETPIRDNGCPKCGLRAQK